jgi:hypothetical protein
MKIIIIDHEPFSSVRKKNFFVEEFINDGFELEYWVLKNIIDYSKHSVYNSGSTNHDVYVRNIETIDELKKNIKKIDPSKTVFFVELWFRKESLYIFKLLFKYKIRWMRLMYYKNPVDNFLNSYPKVSEKLLITLKNKFKSLFAFKTSKAIYFKLFFQRLNKKFNTANVVFYSGNNKIDTLATKYLSINYFDVENYKSVQFEEPVMEQPYIVFTDICLSNHPDLQMLANNNYLDVQKYHDKLKYFFDLLETKLNMPVVVAAHPKSNYTNELGNRPYYKHVTGNLVHFSSLVISHTSLSISYSLLSKKNTIQIYTDEFFKSEILCHLLNIMKNVGEQCDLSTINIDDEHALEIFNNYDLNLKDSQIAKFNIVLDKFFLSADDEKNYQKIKTEILKTFNLSHKIKINDKL